MIIEYSLSHYAIMKTKKALILLLFGKNRLCCTFSNYYKNFKYTENFTELFNTFYKVIDVITLMFAIKTDLLKTHTHS